MTQIGLFQDLASAIRKKWASLNYDERFFSEIATESLKSARLQDTFDVFKLLDEFENTHVIDSNQAYSNFSDLQLIPYRDSKFYIEVLHWTNGTTTIHEHAFYGAFCVVLGESINVEYDFSIETEVNFSMKIGSMAVSKAERLVSGDIRTLYPSRKSIHSIFHLAIPSVTVVVRTINLSMAMPQYEYRFPHIAVDTQNVNIDVIKRVQSRLFRLSVQPNIFQKQWLNDVSNLSVDELYWTIRTLGLDWMNDDARDALEARFSSQSILLKMLTSLQHEKNAQKLAQLRMKLTTYEHRLLLAVAMSLQDRASMFLLLKQFWGQDLHKVFFSVLTELTNDNLFPESHTVMTDDIIRLISCPKTTSLDLIREIDSESLLKLNSNVLLNKLIN